MEFTIPAGIDKPIPEIDELMHKFGVCRRRAYAMKRKGIDRLEIIRWLTRELELPARYVVTAYDSIKTLPPHVTFGGLELQRLRERGKISKDEFHKRRNSVLACRGEGGCGGNLCLRIDGGELRVTVGTRQWVRVPIFIPKKYCKYLQDSAAYTVLLKRRPSGKGYDVRITVDVEEPAIEGPKRVMALDINSGHVDFAVVEKDNLKPITFGKVNCPRLVNARRGKKRILTHKLVNKVGNIARHYGAEVVAGKLKTLHSKGRKKANRKAQGMNQYTMRQIMRYKLPMKGIPYRDMPEGHTSKVGRKLSKHLGVDLHKAAAYAFAVKVTDCDLFTFLRGVPADEGDGIPSVGLSVGSGPTALHQALCLMHNELHAEACGEATPKFKVWAGGFEPLQNHILQATV